MASTSRTDALPRVTCPNHPDAILVEDYRAGDMICPECGLVVVMPENSNFPYRRYDRLPPIHQFSIESDTDLSETAELIEEYEVFDPARPRPKIILVIGGPGSGKGTQSLKIAERYGFQYISVGELLRKKIHSASSNRKWSLIAKIITNGELAPQETTITEIKQKLMQIPDEERIVIDGFPRDVAQALSFEDQPLKMHCRDCALVTSSGHLLRSRQGPQIDQTECVIRMNDAPTRGYGRDVGNRTSLRVIAHSSIQRILRNRHDLLNVSQVTVFIFWGPSSYMRRDGKGQVYNNLQLLSQVLPRLKAFMITRHKMLQFDELFKQETGKDRKISNTWLSTGWFTMTIALELCDRINVYGMVPPDFCRDPNHLSVPYHYYEPFGPDECTMYLSHERGRKGSHHRFITEKRVFKNWARTFNIHFFQPDWKPESPAVNHLENKPVF